MNPSPDTPNPILGCLEEMTLEEVEAFHPEVVVLPLGSIEPHGPHLPLGTDCFQVTRLSRLATQQANEQGARALLYPTLPITTNVNMGKIPFALGVGVDTLKATLIDIARKAYADGIRKMVWINGHGGNPAVLDATLREMATLPDVPFTCQTMGFYPEGKSDPSEHWSDHAGENETSRMLWIRPDLVRTSKLGSHPFGELQVPSLSRVSFVRPWHLYMPATCGGDNRRASAEKGQAIIEGMAEGIATLLTELSQAPYHDQFPYQP